MQPLVNFYIHPESTQSLHQTVNRLNGVPALYTFEWFTESYKPAYNLTIMAEGTSLDNAATNARNQLVNMGVGFYDSVTLNLVKLENKVYTMNRETMSANSN